MSYPPSITRTSSLAIWSLVCGIFAYLCLCLGFVPAIAAVLLGHFALSAIGDSAGTLTGRGLAIGGLVLGYLGLALTVGGFAYTLSKVPQAREAALTVKAWSDTQEVSSAMDRYLQTYGQLPPGLVSSEDLTFTSDNNRVFDLLEGKSDNPKGMIFYAGTASAETPPRNGFGPDGVLYDPWGHPYFIRLDSNGDGTIANPYATGGGPAAIARKVLVWSQGPDGQPGHNGDGNGESDVLSWQDLKRAGSFDLRGLHFDFSDHSGNTRP